MSPATWNLRPLNCRCAPSPGISGHGIVDEPRDLESQAMGLSMRRDTSTISVGVAEGEGEGAGEDEGNPATPPLIVDKVA